MELTQIRPTSNYTDVAHNSDTLHCAQLNETAICLSYIPFVACFCGHCGQATDDPGDIFCGYCGNQLDCLEFFQI